jgi:D-serine deaminase-like pyridoxal phosphate-dependent protein
MNSEKEVPSGRYPLFKPVWCMRSVTDIDTPSVTILMDRVEANIARIQSMVAGAGLANRPHIKTHKIPQIARLQMAAGAVGLTCQKLSEAEAFIDAGAADDILITFNIVGGKKLERLMALSKRVRRLAVVADSEIVLAGISAVAQRHGLVVPFLIECDTGFGRNGVQSPSAAVELARIASGLPGVRFEGIMTFPVGTPNARTFLAEALDAFAREKIEVPVVSGGGTPALLALRDFPMLTEYRAGTYVYNDVMMMASGIAGWQDCALQVRATVVSRPSSDRAIVDAGSKILTREQYYVKDYGRVVEYPEAVVSNLSEEHGMIDLSRSAAKPAVGDVVSIIPNHCCVVSNMVDRVYAVRDGVVEEIYPVAARGAVW